ncbi:MAG: Gfo/Idh/MocA family oxidoreductase [Legionella sp.]|nr:Gfo/Idh/MocA family oxidoreductase [Legionella sp.]
MTGQLNVLIIGCGKIAGGFDASQNAGTLPCTHAGAFSEDTRFNIVACVDPDNITRSRFIERWNIPWGFNTLEEALGNQLPIDIISICSPTAFHKSNLLDALKFKPRLIFCEKPVSESSNDTQLLRDACENAGVLLAVNYTRRWDPNLVNLKQALLDGKYGKLRSVAGFYNKGILNNGSHLIDLLHYLLGDLQVIAVAEPLIDLSVNDPTVPAMLQSASGVPVHLAIGHADDYSFFELHLIFSTGLLMMRDGGLSWVSRYPILSERFPGYRTLGQEHFDEGGYPKAMLAAVDNIFDALSSGASLASTGTSALKAQITCEKIIALVN